MDFNMRTRSSICQCMLSSCTRSKVVGCTLAIKHTRSKVLKRANGCTLSKRTRSKLNKTVVPEKYYALVNRKPGPPTPGTMRGF